MTDIIDYYRLLGVPQDASVKEIKKAYRRLVELYHPDRAGDLDPEVRKQYQEVMILLNKAKEILLDNEKRRQYNRMLDGEEVLEGILVGEAKSNIVEEIRGVMGRLGEALERLHKEEPMIFEVLGVEMNDKNEVEMVLEMEEFKGGEGEEALEEENEEGIEEGIVVGELVKEEDE
ncbi:MAG: J domain-containing protein [Thermoplasmata archaeon]|nr:J domain-containing protein [Thermoplasmata archaeon]